MHISYHGRNIFFSNLHKRAEYLLLVVVVITIDCNYKKLKKKMGNSGRRDREAENAGGHYLFRMRD